MLDSAILEYSPLSSEFDSVQFESEWSILRTFQSSKKKPPAINTLAPAATPPKTASITPIGSAEPSRPPTPPSTAQTKFASLRQTFGKGRPPSGTLATVNNSAPPSPQDITSFMTALHTLLTLSDINPVLAVQLWSQVMYWAACKLPHAEL